jgi:hypothetical protein
VLFCGKRNILRCFVSFLDSLCGFAVDENGSASGVAAGARSNYA